MKTIAFFFPCKRFTFLAHFKRTFKLQILKYLITDRLFEHLI